MRAGKLKRYVTLYDEVKMKDSLGGVSVNWANARSVYASADALGGREFIAAQGLSGETVVLFTMRMDTTFSQTSKIVMDGVDYRVRQVRNVASRDRELEVVAVMKKPT